MPDASPKLSLLVLKTHQLESLLAFYQHLGISFASEQHGTGPQHYSGQLDWIEVFLVAELEMISQSGIYLHQPCCDVL